MSELNFVGDIENVALEQLEFIRDVIRKNGFEATEVEIKELGQVGDNNMSSVKRIAVTENGKTLKMVAKLAPESSMLRKLGNLDRVFCNEHIIYTQLLPKFRQMQEDAGVPKDDLLRFAKCYGTNLVEPYEVILLEDLNEDNFVMLDRFKPLTNDCVKSALKTFAIYHSLSFVLKHREPKTFNDIASHLLDMFSSLAPREDTQKVFKAMEDNIVALMSADGNDVGLIKGSLSRIMQYAENIRETLSEYSAIQQGDGWTNNILFKFQNGDPVANVLIDYQNSHENSPAFDLMYMLFSSTTHEQRLSHYHDYLDYYHKMLDRSLQYFGLSASSIYPREQIDMDFKKYGRLMFSSNIFLMTFMLRKNDQASKIMDVMKESSLDETDVIASAFIGTDLETIAMLKKKIHDLEESFLKFGLIEKEHKNSGFCLYAQRK